tara:strand:- start:60 stop:758 length:699 start_codon:yes stop_codon:yes gene_type:complete
MTDPVEDLGWNDRRAFLRAGITVEFVVLLVGCGLGWVAGIDPWSSCQLTLPALGWGVLATVPLLVAFGATYRISWAPLVRIRELLVRMLGRPMSLCRWHELLLLATLAGVCEEILFRGVILPWMAGDDLVRPLTAGFLVALVGSNLLFALLHPVTPTYSLLVGVVGVYLGLVGLISPLAADPTGMTATMEGAPNLVVPMVAHGLYDFLAFLVIAHEARRLDLGASSGEQAVG